MNLQFNRVIINNFLSIGKTDLELQDNGFVLIKGVNHNTEDVALSNGSGKSTLFEAIIWCLCGETLRGSKNVSNIYGNDGALVELFFTIDNTSYHIIRSKDNSIYKTTLKIFVDDKDISGKGIRDTEKILAETIPELTKSFVGSVIVLGQGMPQKFTNNSPSGRKEVLEKLSKSDFMIEDLKRRVVERKSILQKEMREYEDSILSLNSKLETHRSVISDSINKLKNLESKDVYEERLEKFNSDIQSKYKEKELLENSDELLHARSSLENLSNNYESLDKELYYKTQEFNESYNKEIKDINDSILSLSTEKNNLLKYITDVENMTEICPTCHQRIEGVVKPDTTTQKVKLQEVIGKLNTLENNKQTLTNNFKTKRESIESDILTQQQTIKENIAKEQDIIKNVELKFSTIETSIKSLDKEIQECKNFINIIDIKRETLQQTIEEGQHIEAELCTQIHKENLLAQETDSHLSVISKFDTLLKRDFRGYLLSNVINYIDSRAKSYAQDVFDTTEIDFKLEGNNINICFQGKDYENLSGGEKQKIDLIVQFSIRDMLSEYMNFSSSILVLDEIFDSLDSIGCEKVINMINKRFTDVNSIYIISHHAEELSIPVDSTLTVIKESTGVSHVI